MDQNDKQAIEGLFGKLAQVETQNPGRDAQAEAFISQAISRQPGAPYYMAQTIVVQEHALNSAQERIAQLEQEVEEARQAPAQGGGIFSRMFGGGQPAQPQRRPIPQQPQRPAYAPQPGAAPAQGGGGGFLAGAAQTAVGVAGGMLLGNAVMGMFGGDEAQAAQPAPEPEPAPVEEEEASRGYEEEAEDFGGFDDE